MNTPDGQHWHLARSPGEGDRLAMNRLASLAPDQVAALPRHEREERVRLLDLGADDFVVKPVEPERLFAVLLRWLQRCETDLRT